MNAEEITAGGGAESSFFVVSGTPGGKNWQVISMYAVDIQEGQVRYSSGGSVPNTETHICCGRNGSCIRVVVIDGVSFYTR